MKPFYLIIFFFPVTLLSQFRIYGTVKDSFNQAFDKLEVRIEQLNISTFTNDLGYFEFKNIPSGKYAVSFDYLFDKEYRSVEIIDHDTEYSILLIRRINFQEVTIVQSKINNIQPITASILSKDQIELNQTEKDIPYLMDKLVSTQVQSDAGNGVGYTDLRIRGIDPQHIQYNLNGVPVNDAESSRAYLVDLPDVVNSVDQIKVSTGFVPGRSGPGSFGAAVDLFTNALYFKPFAKVKTRFASYNTRGFSLQANSGLFEDQYNLEVRLSNLKSDGFIDRSNSNLKSLAISAVKIKPKYSIRFNLFNGKEITGQAWNGLPYSYFGIDSLYRYNVSGTEKPGQPYNNEIDNYSQTHTQIFYNRHCLYFDLQYTGNYTRGVGFYENYKANQNILNFNLSHKDTLSSDLIIQKWLSNHFIYNCLSLEREWNKSLSSYLAIAHYYYTGEHYGRVIWSPLTDVLGLNKNYYLNTGVKNEFSVLTHVSKIWNAKWNTLLDFHMRQVNYNILGSEEKDTAINISKKSLLLSPKILVSYQQSHSLQFNYSCSYYEREPYREELLLNPNLSKEKLLAFDFGFKWNKLNGFAKLNYYLMLYKDYLALNGEINSTGDPLRINVPKAIRQGIEFQFNLPLWKKIELNYALNLSSNQVKNLNKLVPRYNQNFDFIKYDTSYFSNVSLAFSPSFIQSVELIVHLFNSTKKETGLDFSVFLKSISKQYLDISESESSKLPAYSILNSKLNYKVKIRNISLQSYLQMNNLLNKKFSSHGWYSNYIIDGTYEPGSNPYEGRVQSNQYFSKGLFPQALRNISFGLDLIF